MPLDQDLNEFSTASPKLINFSNTDVLSGNSYIKFFPCIANLGGVLNFYLTREILDSQAEKISITGSTGSSTDFDSTFAVAAYVKGDCFVNRPWYNTYQSQLP